MRSGVFICKCGPNISEKIDVEEVKRASEQQPGVVSVVIDNFPCSPAGKNLIRQTIKEQQLTHCVFAACSHREHEKTFARLLDEAGLNPYMMEMANIREHVAWMISDKPQATARAIFQVRAALAKVRHNQPLLHKEIAVSTAVAVIGGGIAGIKAAKLAARDGRQVYLIERAPSVGGKMPCWEKSYPTMECNPCFLAPEIDGLKEIGNIEVLTNASIDEIVGFFGSFTVRLTQRPRYVNDGCMACGECGKACPVRVDDPFHFGLAQRGAIHVPFPGCLPALASIDHNACRRYQGEACDKCAAACLFGAIDYSQADARRELAVGGIILATGFDVPAVEKLDRFGGGRVANVYSAAQVERMLSSTGPTHAHLQLADGSAPQSVAILGCAGRAGHCSRVCCAIALKYARFIAEHNPEISVTFVHHDLCLAGEGLQRFHDDIVKAGKTSFRRMADYRRTRVVAADGRPAIIYPDAAGQELQVAADMVVLAAGMEPAAGSDELCTMLAVERNRDGFIAKNHAKMDPSTSGIAGIYVAGCAGGPMDVQETVMSGEAAAGQAATALRPGEKVRLEVTTAYADDKTCSGCRACIAVCPYKAITADEEKKIAVVSEVLCKGCGTCAAACPSGAMHNHHFEYAALRDSLTALLGR